MQFHYYVPVQIPGQRLMRSFIAMPFTVHTPHCSCPMC